MKVRIDRVLTSMWAKTLFRWAVIVALAPLFSGCASHYVDTALSEILPEKIKKVETPKPAQLLFDFQTKGVSNATVTEHFKQQVTTLTQSSGLFSQISTLPVNGAAILNIVINNVPLTDGAFGKGFVTGLTFGLAGNTVTDGYVCTITYLSDAGPQKIVKTVRHAIHTTVGAQGAPIKAEPSPTAKDAVEKMIRQIVMNGLNELALDPNFR